MSIQDLFDTEAPRTQRQDNWLRLVAAIPGVKRAFNDKVTPEDVAVADEAQGLLVQASGNKHRSANTN